MEFNSYYDSLLTRTYDRVSSGLELHYLKEYFTYYEALFTQDDILTLNRYQKLRAPFLFYSVLFCFFL